MSEQPTSQVQHEASHSWKKMVEEQSRWTEGVVAELGRLETAAADQTRAALEEVTHLAKESLAYGMKLSSEWRRLGVESMKRAADLFSARS